MPRVQKLRVEWYQDGQEVADIKAHARALAASTGGAVNVSEAIRDLIRLGLGTPSRYDSGYAEGYRAGRRDAAEQKMRAVQQLQGLAEKLGDNAENED